MLSRKHEKRSAQQLTLPDLLPRSRFVRLFFVLPFLKRVAARSATLTPWE